MDILIESPYKSTYEIDDNFGVVEKTVSQHKATKKSIGEYNMQGHIYMPKKFVGKTCIILLSESADDTNEKIVYNIDSQKYSCSGIEIKDVKSIKTSEKYTYGRICLPYKWYGKTVKIFTLKNYC